MASNNKKKKIDLGIFFGDGVAGIESKLRLPKDSQVENSRFWDEDSSYSENKAVSQWRLVPIYICISLVLIGLVSRAFKLQLIDGASFLNKAEGNSVQIKTNHAPRGIIYDRNGKVLARNKPGFRIAVRKVDLPKDWKEEVVEVAKLIKANPTDWVNLVKESKQESITIATDLSNEQIISLRTNEEKYPWIDIEIYPKREYPYGEIVAPLLGYTGETSVADLALNTTVPYSAGDQVGKAGIEASFEGELRGANGYSLIKVDSQNKKQRALFDTRSVAGSDITLSIDIDLQKYVYDNLIQTLRDKGGSGASAVVSDPNTGEILALVSTPSYNNNIFSGKLSNNDYQALINDPGHLLLNRPIATSFPPGSTFKLVVAAAGIETGKIDKNTRITDTGFVQLGDVTFNNWLWLDHQRTEGEISIVRAIARSNDTYFYRLGQMLGEDTIATFAHQFGFGEKTLVQLPGEVAGLVPTAQWKEKTFNQVWFPGETLNYAIGQGYLLVTPLQLNRMTSVFASGGKLLQPTVLHNGETQITRSDFLKAETVSIVREGMYENTIGDGNVSYLFNNFRIKSAGKTGSAESGGENKSHSWYTAYAPFDSPKLVATVMFERAGHGSEISAPIVKNIFNWYFK